MYNIRVRNLSIFQPPNQTFLTVSAIYEQIYLRMREKANSQNALSRNIGFLRSSRYYYDLFFTEPANISI